MQIDILYLDPPWTLPVETNAVTPLEQKEATAEELVQWLDTQVFAPMFQRGFDPRLIVMKTRFGYEAMQKIQYRFGNYSHIETIKARPFRNDFYFHVLVNNSIYAESEWIPGDRFNKIYKNIVSKYPHPHSTSALKRYRRNPGQA
jgi:hypothetical protein